MGQPRVIPDLKGKEALGAWRGELGRGWWSGPPLVRWNMDETEENFWRGTRGAFGTLNSCYFWKFLDLPMWEFTAHFADVFGLKGWRWKWWRCVGHVIVISPFPLRRLDRWIGLARLSFSKIPQNSFCWPWAHRMNFCTIYSNQSRGESHTMQFNSDVTREQCRSDEENVLRNIFCPQIWVAGTHRVWSARDLWRHGAGDMKRVR